MENITGGKLLCEICDTEAYDTTDKTVDGEIRLVCFKCKDSILTERNIGNDDSYDDDQEGEENRPEDIQVVNIFSPSPAMKELLEEDRKYEQQMYDRFGVGGRY